MSYKLYIIALIFRVLALNRLFFFLNRNRKRIISYHNVIPDKYFRELLVEGVSHSESIFNQQINYIRNYYYFDLNPYNKKSVTLTFDDGYKNQGCIAGSTLTKLNVKAYFFCTLNLLQTGKPLFCDELMLWLSYAPSGTYSVTLEEPERIQVFSIDSDKDRLNVWEFILREIKRKPNLIDVVRRAFDKHVPFSEIRNKLDSEYLNLRFSSLTKDDLDTLKDEGHLVASHSESHRIMSSLEEYTLDDEFRNCRKEFEKTFNSRVFCYPFGSEAEVNQAVIDKAQLHGFSAAFANSNTPLHSGLKYSNFFMPRIALPNTSNRMVLDFILSGAKYFLQHRCLLPLWSS